MQKQIAKFQVGDLLPIGMTIIVLGIGLAYGLKVMGDVSDTVGEDTCTARTDGFTTWNATYHTCANSSGVNVQPGSAQYNATIDATTAVAQIPSNLGTIVSVIVAAVVIGILVTYLMVRFQK